MSVITKTDLKTASYYEKIVSYYEKFSLEIVSYYEKNGPFLSYAQLIHGYAHIVTNWGVITKTYKSNNSFIVTNCFKCN